MTLALARPAGRSGPFDPSALPVFYAAWRAGDLTTADLAEHMDWIFTSHGVAEHAELALEMLRAVGYVTDSPHLELPDRITVYRAQIEGQPPGLSWTPWRDHAEFFGRRWANAWAEFGQPIAWSVLTGVVRRRDVLLWIRSCCEIAADPSDVRRAPRATPTAGSWATITAEEVADVGRSMWDRQGRLLARLMAAGPPTLLEAVAVEYLQTCQAHEMGVI